MKSTVVTFTIIGLLFIGAEAIGPSDWKFHTTKQNTILSQFDTKQHEALSKQKQTQINEIMTEINRLARKINSEEDKLAELKYARNLLEEKDFFWFFHNTTRKAVQEEKKLIRDQQRKIEDTVHQIESEWDKLKPIYGIWSKMFLVEALWPIVAVLNTIAELFYSTLSWGLLISLLAFGSFSGLFLVSWFSLGYSILRPLILLGMLTIDMYYIVEMPFVMIKYNPTISEFFGLFAGGVVTLMLFTIITFKLLFPNVHIKVKRD